MKVKTVILAAGQGTRMKSALPKVMHPILGQPLVWYALQAAAQATGERPVVVIGHGADLVRQALGDQADYALQEQQLGTGHAVLQAENLLRDQAGLVLVTLGDMPLLTADTLRQVIAAQQENDGPLSMLTVELPDSHGFGRIVRAADGSVQAIVEELHASPAERAIKEVNPSVYCFDGQWLWEALRRLKLSPKGEYYLTDLVGLAVSEGHRVAAVRCEDPVETIGINTRVHLAEAAALMRQRINTAWMLAGVTLMDPAITYIEPTVQIGPETVIWPNTYLHGQTIIGADCQIGPNTIIHDSQVGSRCELLSAVIESAVIEDDVDVGPFAHLRKGAHLAAGVHMGNFGEIKNSYLGPGVKMGHFSYIGDAQIGGSTNIGAGTITCNYDGARKHKTRIGKDVFIGSDTMLVAPLNLGDGARTGAGSVVTHDVDADTLVVGVPARPVRKLGTS